MINSAKIADQTEVLQYSNVCYEVRRRGGSRLEGDGDGVSSARLMDKTPDEKERN